MSPITYLSTAEFPSLRVSRPHSLPPNRFAPREIVLVVIFLKHNMSTSLPFLEFLDSSQLPSGWSPSSLTWLMRSHMIWPEPTGADNFEHVPDSGAQLVKASTLRPHSALRFLNSLTLLTRTLSSSLSKATADLKHQAQQNRKELLQAGCLHCQFLSRGTDWKITKKQV